jgi:hypothetical protein
MKNERVVKKSNRDYFQYETDEDFTVSIPIRYFPLPIHGKKDQIQQAWKNDQ